MEKITKIYGECKRCGACCKNIEMNFKIENKFKGQFLKHDFNDIVKRHIGNIVKDNPNLDFSKVERVEFYLIKSRIGGSIQGINCTALIFDETTKKYGCKFHDNKPEVCEDYPDSNSYFRKGCGYFKRTIKVKSGDKKC